MSDQIDATPMTAYVGRGESWTHTIRELDDRGRMMPATRYDGSETLACVAGYGDDRASAFSIAAAWATPPAVTLELADAATAGVAPGLYRVYLTTTAGSSSGTRQIGLLRLLPVPGSAEAGPTYCTMDDVLAVCPWVETAITADPRMQSDLAEQRAKARAWLDQMITNLWRGQFGHGGRLPVDASFGANSSWGGVYAGDWGPDKWIRDQLDDDCLIVRDWVKECTARYAVGLVYENQIGDVREGVSHMQYANYQFRRAESVALSNVAELDGVGGGSRDGWPDLTIRLGVKTAR